MPLKFIKLPDDFRSYGFELAPARRPRLRRRPAPPPDTRPLCRHCGTGRASRPRGLCWTCYYGEGIRDLYPPTHPNAIQGTGNVYRKSKMPEDPTTAPPGSEGKILVMIARAARCEMLFHPDDDMTL